MAVFMRLGWFMGDDTPFESIRYLPPNARLVWSAAGFQISGGPFFVSPDSTNRIAAMDKYAALFSHAIQRQDFGGRKLATTLSGGRDSRHILLELHRHKKPVAETVTLRRSLPVQGDDLSVATAVANKLGYKHVCLTPRRSSSENEFRKNRLAHFCTDEGHWLVEVGEHFSRAGTEILYDGLAGDVLSAGLFQEPAQQAAFRERRFDAVADAILNKWCPDGRTTQPFLPPPFDTRLDHELSRRRMVEEMHRHQDAANPIASFTFWNRTRRGVALSPLSLFPCVKTVAFPYLDHAVFDFLMSLEPSITVDTKFHTDTIAHAFPEFASMPYNDASSTPAKSDALRSLLRLGGYSLLHNPMRVATLAKWAYSLARRRPLGRVPRRRVHYLIQFESECGRLAPAD